MVFIVQSFCFQSLQRAVLAGEYLRADEESSPCSCWGFKAEDNEILAAAMEAEQLRGTRGVVISLSGI